MVWTLCAWATYQTTVKRRPASTSCSGLQRRVKRKGTETSGLDAHIEKNTSWGVQGGHRGERRNIAGEESDSGQCNRWGVAQTLNLPTPTVFLDFSINWPPLCFHAPNSFCLNVAWLYYSDKKENDKYSKLWITNYTEQPSIMYYSKVHPKKLQTKKTRKVEGVHSKPFCAFLRV